VHLDGFTIKIILRILIVLYVSQFSTVHILVNNSNTQSNVHKVTVFNIYRLIKPRWRYRLVISSLENCICFYFKTVRPMTSKAKLWLDFKLSPCFESCMYSFGYFPGVWLLYVDVSEHSICSIFIGWILRKRPCKLAALSVGVLLGTRRGFVYTGTFERKR
jgi:hypothetical protein